MHFSFNLHRRLIVSAGMALAAVSPVAAHDIWVVGDKPGPQATAEIVFGDLTGPTLADVKRIVSFDLVTPTGTIDLRPLLSEDTSDAHPVLKTAPFDAPAGSVIAVTYDNGFWVNQPGNRETNTSPLLAPKAEDPHWTVKWGKMLVGPGASGTTLGTRLELVAMQDPFTAKPGSTIPVRLLYEGQPLADAEIAYTDGLAKLADSEKPVVKTDANGIAQIPVGAPGPLLLTTDVNTPPAHSALASSDHLYASLTYDTSKAR
jgi:uncharacterized GH25 family protein